MTKRSQPDPNTPLGHAWLELVQEVVEHTERRGDGRAPELAYLAISGPNVHVFAREHTLADGRRVPGNVGKHVEELRYDAEKAGFIASVSVDERTPGRILFDALWALEATLLKQREDARRK